MHLNGRDFERLLSYPSHTLEIRDFAVVWVDVEDDDPYVAIVLRLKHSDLPDVFDQLYKLPPRLARHFSKMIRDNSTPPE